MLAGQTVNVLTVDWQGLLGVSAGASLVSLLMSVDRERVVASPVAAPVQTNLVSTVTGEVGCGESLR